MMCCSVTCCSMDLGERRVPQDPSRHLSWPRTNGVAAKAINIDNLGEKVRRGTVGKIKVG